MQPQLILLLHHCMGGNMNANEHLVASTLVRDCWKMLNVYFSFKKSTKGPFSGNFQLMAVSTMSLLTLDDRLAGQEKMMNNSGFQPFQVGHLRIVSGQY